MEWMERIPWKWSKKLSSTNSKLPKFDRKPPLGGSGRRRITSLHSEKTVIRDPCRRWWPWMTPLGRGWSHFKLNRMPCEKWWLEVGTLLTPIWEGSYWGSDVLLFVWFAVRPGRLTWTIIMEVRFRSFSFVNGVICRFHVNLPECMQRLLAARPAACGCDPFFLGMKTV